MMSPIFVTDSEAPWEAAGEGVRRKVLTWNDTIMLVRVAFEAGAVGPPHSHPHVQCSLIESGVFEITISGETKRLSAGDSFIVPSDALHGAKALTEGSLVDVFTPARQDFVSPR
jgi:quercetin dioxygenase-like cupin family protein